MSWLGRLFSRKRLEIDLEKELRYHFEMQVAQKLLSGVPESEARRLRYASSYLLHAVLFLTHYQPPPRAL